MITSQSIRRKMLLAGLLSTCAAQFVHAEPTPAPAAVSISMNRIVQEQAYPQLDYFLEKLDTEKEQVSIDGFAPFQSNDKFLPGKIAAGLGDVLLHTPKDDPGFGKTVREFRDVADMTVHMDNHTWGIYYYVSTLYALKQAGLLDQAVSAPTLALLKKQLDWRTFVTQPDFKLIGLPTNYYGVAFSIARLRMLLGWEDEAGSKILMRKLLEHYAAYSGKYGFSDETAGQGRFDRYSILLAADAAGGLIGGVILETRAWLTPRARTAFVLALIWCIALIGFARANGYVLAVSLLFVAGFVELAFNSMAQALVQLHAPGAIRGRVIGVFSMSASGLRMFSGLSVGLLGARVGIHNSLAMSAAALFALYAILFAGRYLRSS